MQGEGDPRRHGWQSGGSPGGGTGGGTGAGTYISGSVSGVASSGVTIRLTGASSASAATDDNGHYAFNGLANGSYTVTPSTADAVFFMPESTSVTVSNTNVQGVAFTAFPGVGPTCSLQISGDISSGVSGGTYLCDKYHPPADVSVYDPPNDLWTISFQFDVASLIGLGGVVSFHGTPVVTTYTQSSQGFFQGGPLCWSAQSAPGGNYDESWVATSFSLAFSSVGAAVPTNTPASNGNFDEVDYPVHGTFHAVCTPSSGQGNHASGTVTMDVSF